MLCYPIILKSLNHQRMPTDRLNSVINHGNDKKCREKRRGTFKIL